MPPCTTQDTERMCVCRRSHPTSSHLRGLCMSKVLPRAFKRRSACVHFAVLGFQVSQIALSSQLAERDADTLSYFSCPYIYFFRGNLIVRDCKSSGRVFGAVDPHGSILDQSHFYLISGGHHHIRPFRPTPNKRRNFGGDLRSWPTTFIMHLMFTLDESGNRVYTLKVR